MNKTTSQKDYIHIKELFEMPSDIEKSIEKKNSNQSQIKEIFPDLIDNVKNAYYPLGDKISKINLRFNKILANLDGDHNFIINKEIKEMRIKSTNNISTLISTNQKKENGK